MLFYYKNNILQLNFYLKIASQYFSYIIVFILVMFYIKYYIS